MVNGIHYLYKGIAVGGVHSRVLLLAHLRVSQINSCAAALVTLSTSTRMQ